MAKFTPYALKTLPSSSIDVNGIYFIKGDSDQYFRIYLRKSDNSDWVELGLTSFVNSVNELTGEVNIDLEFDNGKLSILATGDGTASVVAEIDLDNRYRRLGIDIPWSDITGAPNFALDDDVVHKAGSETITGDKTFTATPRVPLVPTHNQHTTSKKYVDDIEEGLQTQIDNIETSIGTGVNIVDEIDCSTNPPFPSNPDGTTKGDSWVVSAAGKIGGSNGRQVDVGNLIIAKVDNARSGSYATAGEDWIILQSDLDQATESTAGFAKIATNAQTDAGTDDKTIITPKKLQRKIDDFEGSQQTSNDGRYVRYDGSQSLSSGQRSTARNNIAAADDAVVVKTSGTQTVGGLKTFSTIPNLPNSNPTSNNQAVRKKYVDDLIAEMVAWGGPNGKEW